MPSFSATQEATSLMLLAYMLVFAGMPGTYILAILLHRENNTFFGLATPLCLIPAIPSVYFLMQAIDAHLSVAIVIHGPAYLVIFLCGYSVSIYKGLKYSFTGKHGKRLAISVGWPVIAILAVYVVTEKPHRSYIDKHKQESYRLSSKEEVSALGIIEPVISDYKKFRIQYEWRGDGLKYVAGMEEPFTGVSVEFYKYDVENDIYKVSEYTTYVEGKMHGDAWEWLRDGSIHTFNQYNQNILEGKHYEWIGGGRKVVAGQYVNGKKNGIWRNWQLNGQLWSEIEYAGGVMHGAYVSYGANGEVSSVLRYENGVPYSD